MDMWQILEASIAYEYNRMWVSNVEEMEMVMLFQNSAIIFPSDTSDFSARISATVSGSNLGLKMRAARTSSRAGAAPGRTGAAKERRAPRAATGWKRCRPRSSSCRSQRSRRAGCGFRSG